MTLLTARPILGAIAIAYAAELHAAILPAEQLLPPDTLGFVTVRDVDKALDYARQSPEGQMWQDPSMTAFRGKVEERITNGLASLEAAAGIHLADFAGLAGGQVTLAGIGPAGNDFKLVVLIDLKEKTSQATNLLDALKSKWTDSGEQLRTNIAAGIEFTVFTGGTNDLGGLFRMPRLFGPGALPPDAALAPKSTNSSGIAVGLLGSMLLIGNDAPTLGAIVARQRDGAGHFLAEQPEFHLNRAAANGAAIGAGWIHLQPLIEAATKTLNVIVGASGATLPGLQPARIMDVSGLSGLTTASFAVDGEAQGTSMRWSLGVPESQRKGFMRIMIPEAKESGPPPFVPADVAMFSRWRINGQEGWTNLQSMIATLSPELAGFIDLSLSVVGKDKDPNFDFKKSFFGNLGDDFITLQKDLPSTNTSLQLPSLFLIGSPKPDELARALKEAVVLLPAGALDSAARERDFMGHKIYTIDLPSAEPLTSAPAPFSLPAPDGNTNGLAATALPPPLIDPGLTNENATLPTAAKATPGIHFAAAKGYLAISTSPALIEEFLRGPDQASPALRDAPGLLAAAPRVGGMGNGLFGYENDAATTKPMFEILRNQNLNFLPPIPFGGASTTNGISEIFGIDPKLLPAFEKISHYFQISVVSGSGDRDGLTWRFFWPAMAKTN